MSDTRIKEFTQFYHEEYKKKYSMIYNWKGGREQKLMQKCLIYFEGIKPKNPLEEMKTAAIKYLNDEEEFYIDAAHDLAHFLTKPEKWVVRERKTRPELKYVSDFKEEPRVTYDDLTFQSKFEEQVQRDPEKAVKGFIYTSSLLKMMSVDKYTRARQYLIDLVGKERILKIYHEAKVLKTM